MALRPVHDLLRELQTVTDIPVLVAVDGWNRWHQMSGAREWRPRGHPAPSEMRPLHAQQLLVMVASLLSSLLAPDAQPPSTTCDGEALAPDAAVLCKIQPPPHALRSDPGSPMTEPHAQTLTVWMPRDALLDNFLAYLEHEYGMRLDVIDALGAGDAHKRGDEPAGPLATDGDFDAALGLAADKAMGAAYFLVRAKLDGAGRPLPPRHAKVEGPFAPDMVEGREKIDEERRAASAAYDAPGGLIPRGFVEERMSAEAVAGDARRAAKAAADAAFWATASDEAKAKRRDADAKRWHDLLPEAGREDLMPGFDDMVDEDTGVLTELIGAYDPKVGRKVFKHGYQCAESEPFPALEDGAAAALEGDAAEAFAARRELLAIIPPPSRLPEHEFPADSMGGRCLDAWRYRWGQRIGDAWLFVPLPPGATVADVDVAFGTFKLGVSLCGVPLYDGPLWNCDETRGVDVDTAAWVVVLHEGQPVLQVELHKKKNYWWKAIWADHPTIEPWEVPFWKDATFNDGYHITHHVNSRIHWTEMPLHFIEHIDKYEEGDAIVLHGVNFEEVSFAVWGGKLPDLADKIVQLREVKRTKAELVEMLRERLKPIRNEDSQIGRPQRSAFVVNQAMWIAWWFSGFPGSSAVILFIPLFSAISFFM